MKNEEEFNEESEGFTEWLRETAKKATQEAAVRAMSVMGYVVYCKDGWVIKEYKDGRIEKITEIKTNLTEEDREIIKIWLNKIK